MTQADPARPRVSALVVCFNNEEEAAASLDALLAQRVEGGLEVVVVDNASTDGTVEVLQRYAARVTLVLRDSNAGYAAGNDEALRLCSGDLVALVNPDCVVDPGCLQAMVDHLEATAGVGLAAALLRNPDGSPQLFARRDVDLTGAFWAFTELGARVDRRWRAGRHAAHRRYAQAWPPAEPLAVDCPAAACVLLWRQLVGERLFDPALPLLFNDADLQRRLRHRSYRLEVVPAATAVHGYGTSLRKVALARMRAERLASLRVYVARDWGLARCAALWLLLVLDACLLLPPALVGRRRSRERALLRGTLGGLGLPGGAPPWLVTVPGPAARARGVVRRVRQRPRAWVGQSSRRWRRAVLVARLRWSAWRQRTDLTVRIHPTAEVHRPHLELRPGRRVVLEIGPRSSLRAGVVLRLGGELLIGAGCDVRWGAVLNVKGRLVLGDRVVVGRGAAVHADLEQRWGFAAVVGEYATVLDSDHVLDGSPVAVFDQPVRAAPVVVGAGAFIGAKATVLPGVEVGRSAKVGAGAVVTRDVPDRGVVVGPAARLREAAEPATLSRSAPRAARRRPKETR